MEDELQLWHRRAEMAFEQGNIELCKQALLKKFVIAKKLALLKNSLGPDCPDDPELLFKIANKDLQIKPQSIADSQFFVNKRVDEDNGDSAQVIANS